MNLFGFRSTVLWAVVLVASMARADMFLEYPDSEKGLRAPSVPAQFGGKLPSEGLAARLVRARPSDGCARLNTTNRPGASKAVVFIERGGDGNDQPCHFVDKVRHA